MIARGILVAAARPTGNTSLCAQQTLSPRSNPADGILKLRNRNTGRVENFEFTIGLDTRDRGLNLVPCQDPKGSERHSHS